MSKSFKIVPSTSTDGASKAAKNLTSTEVSVSFAKAKTKNPLSCQGGENGLPKEWDTLARELIDARDVGFNPLKTDFDRLDEGPGIEQTLRAHQACWHKLCKN